MSKNNKPFRKKKVKAGLRRFKMVFKFRINILQSTKGLSGLSAAVRLLGLFRLEICEVRISLINL